MTSDPHALDLPGVDDLEDWTPDLGVWTPGRVTRGADHTKHADHDDREQG